MVRELACLAKSVDHSLESMWRTNSFAAGRFFAFAGMMNGSPEPALIASNGILAPDGRGIGRNFMSKSAGVCLSCSFSSQEPQVMNAALYWFQRVCDSVWVRPLVPGISRPFSTTS